MARLQPGNKVYSSVHVNKCVLSAYSPAQRVCLSGGSSSHCGSNPTLRLARQPAHAKLYASQLLLPRVNFYYGLESALVVQLNPVGLECMWGRRYSRVQKFLYCRGSFHVYAIVEC